MTNLRLLELDGIGNVLLGLPLLLFPEFVSRFLGLPTTEATFYPAILGAIFVGIGVALLLERVKPSHGGLGLGGAMSINLIFGARCWVDGFCFQGWASRLGGCLSYLYSQ